MCDDLFAGSRCFSSSNFSNPRLDIKWSRLLRPYRHYGHRAHRLRNMNHLNNLRLLNDSPLTPADYQYQASTDQYDLNVVSMSNNRNHRKRHAQYRMKRDLNTTTNNNKNTKKRGYYKNTSSTKRKLVARIK